MTWQYCRSIADVDRFSGKFEGLEQEGPKSNFSDFEKKKVFFGKLVQIFRARTD